MSESEADLRTCAHGLVYDATKHPGCVICRREEEERLPGEVVDSSRRLSLRSLRVLGLALLLGVVVVAAGVRMSSKVEPSEDGPAPGRRIEARSAPGTSDAADSTIAATRPEARRRAEEPALRYERVGAPAAEAGGEPAELAAEEARRERESAKAETERAEAEREAALAQARRRVSVTIYTTDWCPHCTRAKAYMQQAGIRYVERDVESSETYRSRRDRLNPRRSVPTFDVDGEVLVGFSPRSLEGAIDRVAARRL